MGWAGWGRQSETPDSSHQSSTVPGPYKHHPSLYKNSLLQVLFQQAIEHIASVPGSAVRKNGRYTEVCPSVRSLSSDSHNSVRQRHGLSLPGYREEVACLGSVGISKCRSQDWNWVRHLPRFYRMVGRELANSPTLGACSGLLGPTVASKACA